MLCAYCVVCVVRCVVPCSAVMWFCILSLSHLSQTNSTYNLFLSSLSHCISYGVVRSPVQMSSRRTHLCRCSRAAGATVSSQKPSHVSTHFSLFPFSLAPHCATLFIAPHMRTSVASARPFPAKNPCPVSTHTPLYSSNHTLSFSHPSCAHRCRY